MNFHQFIGRKLTACLLAAVTLATPAFAASGTVSADGGLRMRNGAGTDAAVITTLPNGAEVDVSGITEDGWFQVSYMDTMGYVSGDYITISEADAAALPVVADPVYGKVTEGPLNVRSTPSTSGSRVKQLSKGTVVQITAEQDGWYQIDGGYISADYITIVDAAEAAAYNSLSSVVTYAKQYLGYPYVYGGCSSRGFDCSGFVKYVFANFGVTLNRTASAQMDNGTAVAKADLQPGDVVFFKKSGSGASRASHVGIYVGNNQFIHASTSKTGVIISDMDSAYYTTGFVGARRML